MPLSKWLPYQNAIQYDGTNSAEILALIPPYTVAPFDPVYATIDSETGSALTLRTDHPVYGPQVLPIPLNSWVVFDVNQPDQGLGNVTTLPNMVGAPGVGDFYLPAAGFEPEPTDPQVLHVAVGKAALPALLLNGTTSPVVVFDTPMPDANYDLKWRAVSGAAVLSSIVANGAPTKTASQVTIPLRANGLASVAGVLLVEVFKLA